MVMEESLLAALRESPEKLLRKRNYRRTVSVSHDSNRRFRSENQEYTVTTDTYELAEKAETEPMEARMATAENFILINFFDI
jgi:hypothetical protein